MNAEALARYLIFAGMVAGCIVLLVLEKAVPEWLIALTSGIGGNTVRLQVTKPK